MKIIAIEGIDASGKETQSKLLYESLLAMGFKVEYETFPRYDYPIGELIKKVLMGEYDINSEALHMMLEADRVDFMSHIKYLEEQGYDFLVLDRFTLSNLAFGLAKGINLEWLTDLQEVVRKPDLTFIMDITAETSMERKGEVKDLHEQDGELLDKARQAYLALSRDSENIFVLDANDDMISIHRSILALVNKVLIGEGAKDNEHEN